MTIATWEQRIESYGIVDRMRAVTNALETSAAPLLDLAMRLWIARIFFNSGLTKLRDWESTLFLFEYEYQVPVLPNGLAASFATATEIAAPVFLVIGLASRLAALPMLAMTLVIQFALGAVNPAFDNVEHFYWMFVLAMIVIRGPGRISIDHHLARRFARSA